MNDMSRVERFRATPFVEEKVEQTAERAPRVLSLVNGQKRLEELTARAFASGGPDVFKKFVFPLPGLSGEETRERSQRSRTEGIKSNNNDSRAGRRR